MDPVWLTSILEGLEKIKPRMACAPMLNPGSDMTAISGKLTESPFSLRLYRQITIVQGHTAQHRIDAITCAYLKHVHTQIWTGY